MRYHIQLFNGKEAVSILSDVHPECGWSKGWLYDETGFGYVCKELIGKDLSYIFEKTLLVNELRSKPTKYWTSEKWDKSAPVYTKRELRNMKQKAKDFVKELKETPNFSVKTIDVYEDQPEMTQEEALQWALKQHENQSSFPAYDTYVPKPKGGMAWFGFKSPLKVVGLIPGTSTNSYLGGHISFKRSVVHVVYDATDAIQLYHEQAQVMVELLEHALTLDEPRLWCEYTND